MDQSEALPSHVHMYCIEQITYREKQWATCRIMVYMLSAALAVFGQHVHANQRQSTTEYCNSSLSKGHCSGAIGVMLSNLAGFAGQDGGGGMYGRNRGHRGNQDKGYYMPGRGPKGSSGPGIRERDLGIRGASRGDANDYCQHFVDTGQRPQNFLRDVHLVGALPSAPAPCLCATFSPCTTPLRCLQPLHHASALPSAPAPCLCAAFSPCTMPHNQGSGTFICALPYCHSSRCLCMF